MRLTKYQKARLIEFEWDVIEHDNMDDNTCWLQLDEEDGEIFHQAKMILNCDTPDVKTLSLLIVASKVERSSDS